MKLGALLGAAALSIAACGSSAPDARNAAGLPPAGEGGAVVYALDSLPAGVDPLAAGGIAAQVVSRQIHEPLVSVLSAPYGGAPQRIGLATVLRPSADRTVWSVQLRRGVRFQDGTPFNAAAVLANSRRWTSVAAGRRLLPDLFAVDAPRPDEVRFQLDRPVPDLPRLLADPRLGIVSPEALEPPRGQGARFRTDVAGSGTGPFRLDTRGRMRVDLSRNRAWWGTPLGLGPSVESVSFLRAPALAARVGLLRAGAAQIAGPLPAASQRRLASDPLLGAVPRTGGGLGVEASVRGLDPAQPLPLLSGLWLTTLRD